VKLHIHGDFGEYLPPVDRQRYPNPFWFQDYAMDFTHRRYKGMIHALSNPSTEVHHCTYIPGETTVRLPLGRIFVEVSKGFEVRPKRQVIQVDENTERIVIELEKVLDWREKGWVSADTHVHFLSPMAARLEGAAEGVNVVNLLASQWGELMTNVGDFDGRTTIGSLESGGDGEHLVRVGSENRQHVLGHISLLGYNDRIITPLCSGGPDESALGDPIEVLLTEWAAKCRKQGGIVVIHHFQGPRCESAATIISGHTDGIEMTSWGNLYGGIDPYALSDWYRYLNNGYLTAIVGGTDKMSADTAIGTLRTYARIKQGEPFSYDTWKDAVRRAETFVTCGPLLEFSVEGAPPGSRLEMTGEGGTLTASWNIASVTMPMTRVELLVNGEIRESREAATWADSGAWTVNIGRSSWLALLVRGKSAGRSDLIAAHSSPVMVTVAGRQHYSAPDAVTILEQIEGSIAYFDTLGTRADAKRYQQMRLILVSAYRDLHNRMHQAGQYHDHTIGSRHTSRDHSPWRPGG